MRQIAFALSLLFSVDALMAGADDGGRTLAEAVYYRPDGDSIVIHAKMILRSSRGRERIREFYSYSKEFDDGESRTLTRFVKPANVSGTALLVHSRPIADDDQWLFLPALERTRRISSENKGGRFVQSGLYYEDLSDRHPDQDTHRLLGERSYEGTAVIALESTPKNADSSAYSRRVSWIHEPTLLPLKVEYYKNSDTPLKVLEVKQLENIDSFWTVTESVIIHPKTDEETVIQSLITRYNEELPEALFTLRGLSDQSLAQDYRPQ